MENPWTAKERERATLEHEHYADALGPNYQADSAESIRAVRTVSALIAALTDEHHGAGCDGIPDCGTCSLIKELS